jgi:hypothetical protein
MRPEFIAVAAALVGVLGTARFVRLVTADEFPPTEWLRLKWAVLVGEKWGKLLNCLWCFSPYATAVNLAWFLLSDGSEFWRFAWWVANGWLAASYAASWLVFHDEDGSE